MYYTINKRHRRIVRSRWPWAFSTFKQAKDALLNALKEERRKTMNAIIYIGAMYIIKKDKYIEEGLETLKIQLNTLEDDMRYIQNSTEIDWIK